MIRSILICLALTLTFASSATADKEPEVPCGRVCSEMWGKKWTDCQGVGQCEKYIEIQYRICVKRCEEKEGK
jgi:hypothetical protein